MVDGPANAHEPTNDRESLRAQRAASYVRSGALGGVLLALSRNVLVYIVHFVYLLNACLCARKRSTVAATLKGLQQREHAQYSS
jgi:hypothetical protein